MGDISGIPFQKVHFDKSGKRLDEPVVPPGTTDLVVVSHGWNNDEADAEALYTALFRNLADVTKQDAAFAARKLAIIGVIWPSKRFDELMTHVDASGEAGGGARSLGAADRTEAEQAMRDAIARAAEMFDDADDAERKEQLLALQDLVGKLEDEDGEAEEEFVSTLRTVLNRGAGSVEQADQEDSSDRLLLQQPALVYENAKAPVDAPTGTAQGAAGLKSVVSKAVNAVTNLLNLTTYFEMKQRAGTVAKVGVAPMIDQLADQVQRVHLVGHSFGGRLVAATAASSRTNKIHSLSLLQAAFSHNGFSGSERGFFRSVVSTMRVKGPILVTHTKNDKAVGLAYPAASRINRDTASGIGGADDKFGGIGSNGALHMEDGEVSSTATELLAVGKPYTLESGRIHNLKADPFIRDPKGGDAHGFVWVPEVAWAVSRAILS